MSEALVGTATPPLAGRSAPPRVEILFLAHRAPWPPDRGDRIRSWHMLDALTRLAPVHVAALVDSAADAELARPMLTARSKSLALFERRPNRAVAAAKAFARGWPISVEMFADARLATHVKSLMAGGTITHIVGFSSQMAQYVPANFPGRFVMDFVDVDSAKFTAYAAEDRWSDPMRHVHAYEGRALRRWEREVAARASLGLFVSQAEADLFKALPGIPRARIRALGNGIDLARFDPAATFGRLSAADRGEGALIVFTGQMDYRPNVEAVSQFARTALPAIRRHHPSARFAIVGRSPSAEVLALAALPGVIVTGEVPDTRPWLAAADVVVAPLSVARGVQNKLLEAMAMARPVVASRAAAEGIDARPGRDLIVADDTELAAEAVVELLDDPALARKIAQAGRARMVARSGWDSAMAPLADMLGIVPAPRPE